MKLNTNNTIKNRVVATCLSALMISSSTVTLKSYEFDSRLISKLDVIVNAFGQENRRDALLQSVNKTLETCKGTYSEEHKEKHAVAQEIQKLLRNLCDSLPTDLAVRVMHHAGSYLHENNQEREIDALKQLQHLLKTRKLPNETLEAIGQWFRKDFTTFFGYLAPTVTVLGTMATLLVTVQSMELNGNALGDLKAAAKSNSKKYPTLTWVQLKSKIPVIKNRLFENLAGQKDAIDNIIIQLNNHCNYLELCEKLGTKPKRSLVLHFYGAPGVGKSSALRIIAEELGIGVISFGMSSAVEDNGKRANTVLARLMNPDVIDTRTTKAYFKTPLRKAVENPGTMIIGFDEIEKMRKLDAQISKCDYRNEEGFISPSSLDEAMRDVKDQGKFAGFDVSDKIFVTISNETDDSLKELEPSFRDRLLGSLIYFKQFDIEAYKELIIKSSRLLFDAYREEDIELSWSESALEHYANIFYKDGYSGRRVVEFIDKVSGIVQNYRDLLKYSRNWIINYNSTLDDIVIENNL